MRPVVRSFLNLRYYEKVTPGMPSTLINSYYFSYSFFTMFIFIIFIRFPWNKTTHYYCYKIICRHQERQTWQCYLLQQVFMEERWVCMLSSSPTEWAKSQKKNNLKECVSLIMSKLHSYRLPFWRFGKSVHYNDSAIN